MAFVAAPGYQPVYNPALPFRNPIYGGLRPGMSVYIQGVIPHHVHRFAVNFSCGQYDGTDIAFHFNPRFDGKDHVVFNSFQSGSWGPEERRHDGFPLHKGRHFELVFIVNMGGYQVNVNGLPFYEYRHRIPIERVQCVHVDGDVTIQSLTVVGGGGYMGGGAATLPSFPPGGGQMPGFPGGNLPILGGPTYNPPVPYFGMMPGGLSSKRTVIVRGFVPMGAQKFVINFKVTSTNEIALHFNPRMNENAVVRNSLLRGSWGNEERNVPFNPFLPGQYFDISIRCGNHRFKIYVNGQHFCDYGHRYSAFQMVDGLEIDGNVVLSLVQF
ncbi:galectin-4-like [Pelobates fuscus]|uniref:galectin-4-like n=1 Tax=Pelobates fuscus TaxID=191477 RepID=UPI002FE43660